MVCAELRTCFLDIWPDSPSILSKPERPTQSSSHVYECMSSKSASNGQLRKESTRL